ncbi:aldehyde dehydrogenase family protein [Ochrobactrum soli]|uniref:Aldehyde dehydrogenase n=1 Tax=Ochrobactrum soli TaxID=2448455 RepID=A0A2P9HE74_9HYPH|nr:aldehyde dehydrogenase family protein [[Ochrobactrum] soli]SPL62365.1 Aldehyde dehydrogenase [[Ochrobactrum] soli]
MTQHSDTHALRTNWINGSWDYAGAIGTSVSPSTGEVVGEYLDIGPEQASKAIEAARAAFVSTPWARNRDLRSRALFELADRLAARKDEIAQMLSREGGKLIAQTTWEVQGAVEWLRYSAATAILQTGGRAVETAPGMYFHSNPEPMGVVGVITPWNSPVMLSVRAIGPALAAGCTVVLKMPHQTALTAALVAQAVSETQLLPAGVLNVVSESGHILSSMLVDSPLVSAISYTGSTHIGRLIAQNAGKSLKRINLELGGKAPLIVFDDADLDVVVPQIVTALVAMNGQFCCTGSRVLVQHGISEKMRAALIKAYQAVRLGESEDPEAQLGPLIDKASVARVDALIEQHKHEGKVLVRGGGVAEGPLARGAFYRPTLIEVEPVDAFLIQSEVFGPVQTLEVFKDEAEAISRANATEFGLAASVFTADANRARRVAGSLEAGTVWMNCWGIVTEHMEESGLKQSGVGSLCGPRAIEQFQEVKVYVSVDPAPAA